MKKWADWPISVIRKLSIYAVVRGGPTGWTALKQASMTVNQIHFLMSYLKDEIKELNFLESRNTTEGRQNAARGKNQGYQGDKQFRPRCQNLNLVEQRGINQPQQAMGYPKQQQGMQNLQQGNQLFQQGNP